jgi:hypothetical protein
LPTPFLHLSEKPVRRLPAWITCCGAGSRSRPRSLPGIEEPGKRSRLQSKKGGHDYPRHWMNPGSFERAAGSVPGVAPQPAVFRNCGKIDLLDHKFFRRRDIPFFFPASNDPQFRCLSWGPTSGSRTAGRLIATQTVKIISYRWSVSSCNTSRPFSAISVWQ